MDNDLLDITKLRRWRIWKLKLIDARLYFVSIFVGLLTGLVAVPYHYLLQQLFNSRKLFFDGHYPWYFHVLFFFTLWGILLCVNWMVKKMPLITGGGIPQTRAVINGRITYKNPLTQLIAKFTGGILAISAGLSLGREGPCVQIGSYVGNIISKWGHVLAGERKQLLAAGAGAGLAAAFAAPLASSLLVIESIERFDAPKTAITTLLAGVVAGGVASLIFPFNPYSQISAIAPQATFIDQLKLFLFLAVVISVFGKIYSMFTLWCKDFFTRLKHPPYMKMLYLLIIDGDRLDRRRRAIPYHASDAWISPRFMDSGDDAHPLDIHVSLFLLRTAGREFHPYTSYRGIVRADHRLIIGEVWFH